jgi:flagellar biosynthesis chaperone FliJ
MLNTLLKFSSVSFQQLNNEVSQLKAQLKTAQTKLTKMKRQRQVYLTSRKMNKKPSKTPIAHVCRKDQISFVETQ